jgi:hypothetical protein
MLIFGTALTAAGAPAAASACDAARHASAHSVPAGAGRAPLQIGDSTSIFAAPVLGTLGVESDAHGCRQFSQGLGILAARAHAHTLPAVVVLSLGANGAIGPGEIGHALRILGRSRILALVTARHSPTSTARMRAAAAAHPDRVLLIDWVGFSAAHGGWFGGDGLHVNPQGAAAYAHLIRRRIAPYAFPPVTRLGIARHTTRAVRCGAVHHAGARLAVWILRGHGKVLCPRARALARLPVLRPAAGWTNYDWRRAHHGPWRWVLARRRGIVVATTAGARASAASVSPNPPAWAGRRPVCLRVNFMTDATPSGMAGEAGGGYNVYWLSIVGRKGVSCSTARRLARKAWITGKARPLHWRKRRQWRTSSGGSAWVGDFVGSAPGRRVEYLAVH